MTHWLVLPSPFLGSAAYAPLVDALQTGGDDAAVATYAEPPVADALVAAWSHAAGALEAVVLVPHSNAGYLAPLVSDRCGGLPIVFMDAALPVSAGPSALAPPELSARLAELVAGDGLLPRWTRWWTREDVAATLPDPWFDRVDAVVPEVPLAYVDGEVPVPDGWADGRCAYLAFGSTYADELALAARHGWPHHRLEGAGHLHLLLEPDETAAAVVELASRTRG